MRSVKHTTFIHRWFSGGMVALWGLVYVRGLHRHFDLSAADEGLYVQRATLWAFRHLPVSQEWGPLYHFWYVFLLRWTDPPTAYYWNLYVTYLLPPVLLSLWVYRLTRQAFWSLGAGLAFLMSWANYGDWRVNHFLLAFLLLGFLLLPDQVEQMKGVFWLAAQAFLASLTVLIRPEMVLAAMAFLGWGVVRATRSWREGRTNWTWRGGVLALLAVAGLIGALLPAFRPSGRMLGAFGQHFAVRWVARTHVPLNPYADWQQVLEEQFGPVHSLWDAVRRRPDLMAWFVTRNVLGWGRVLLQQVVPFPYRWPWWVVVGMGTLLLVGLMWRLQVRRVPLDPDFWHWWGPAIAIWALPGVLSSWLFYPRPHYQAVPLALAWGALALVLAQACPLSPRKSIGWGLGVLVLLLFGAPRPYQHPQPQPRLRTVCRLRAALQTVPRPRLYVTQGFHEALLYLADLAEEQRLLPPFPDHPPEPVPDLWFPWPFPEGRRQQIPWLAELALTLPRQGFRPLVLPDGSQWLSRIPVPDEEPARRLWEGSICAP